MIERQPKFEAVLIVVLKGNKVLLHKRKNTGWMDGWYDLPSGHVDSGESILEAAVREVYEEVGIKISTRNLELFHVSQANTDKSYTYFIFKTEAWEGQPHLKEPDMAEELDFYPLDSLPEKIPPYTHAGLENIESAKLTLSYFGPKDF
jgi:8-oxo-dGTP diphosphatase